MGQTFISAEDFLARVRRKRAEILGGLKLDYWDCDDIGAKDMDCNWGQCSKEYDDAELKVPGQTCPFDRAHARRHAGESFSGCFYTCDLFKPEKAARKQYSAGKMPAEVVEAKFDAWEESYASHMEQVQAEVDKRNAAIAYDEAALARLAELTKALGVPTPPVDPFREFRALRYKHLYCTSMTARWHDVTIPEGERWFNVQDWGGVSLCTPDAEEAAAFCADLYKKWLAKHWPAQ